MCRPTMSPRVRRTLKIIAGAVLIAIPEPVTTIIGAILVGGDSMKFFKTKTGYTCKMPILYVCRKRSGTLRALGFPFTERRNMQV